MPKRKYSSVNAHVCIEFSAQDPLSFFLLAFVVCLGGISKFQIAEEGSRRRLRPKVSQSVRDVMGSCAWEKVRLASEHKKCFSCWLFFTLLPTSPLAARPVLLAVRPHYALHSPCCPRPPPGLCAWCVLELRMFMLTSRSHMRPFLPSYHLYHGPFRHVVLVRPPTLLGPLPVLKSRPQGTKHEQCHHLDIHRG